MTICAPAVHFDTVEMSVVTRRFVVGEEVKYMTTATALDRLIDASVASRKRPRGIDRVVMSLAVAMLKWSRVRAERNAQTHHEHSHRLQQANSALQREADALRMTQRIGL